MKLVAIVIAIAATAGAAGEAGRQAGSQYSTSPTLVALLVIGSIFQFSFNGLVAFLVYRLTKRDTDVRTLEQKLHSATEKLIDARLQHMTHDVRNHVGPVITALDELRTRLDGSEGMVDKLRDGDHQIEMTVSARFDQLKDWIRIETADKADVKRLAETVGELGKSVAVLADRVGTRRDNP